MVKMNKKENKKRKAFIGFILLLLLLGGIYSAFQTLQVENQMAFSKLLLEGEEILANSGENQVAAVESMAVTFSGGAIAPAGASQPANDSESTVPLAINEFDQFSFLPLFESADDDSEESEEAAEENAEEPQPEEPVYESTAYNFGDSEQFNLTRNVTQEEFDKVFIIKQNSWKIDEDGAGLSPEKGGEGRIFVPNNYLNYYVKVVAALNESTLNSEGQPRNDSGYAVMFETKLDGNNNDAGFALQFDRGFDKGAIVIRPREIGADSKGNPRTDEKSPVLQYKELPSKHENPDWWAKEHQMELRVTGLEGESEKGHNKNLSVYLDDKHLFDWTFESELKEGNENQVGLRVWHESAKEVEIIGLEIGELPATKTEEPALPETASSGADESDDSPEPEALTEAE